jgi:hypothetical protein
VAEEYFVTVDQETSDHVMDVDGLAATHGGQSHTPVRPVLAIAGMAWLLSAGMFGGSLSRGDRGHLQTAADCGRTAD